MAENFNWRDFGIGVGAGWLTAYLLYQLRDVITGTREAVSQRVQEAQRYATLSAEGRYIAELTREAQASHLAGERLALTKIAVEPRFLPPAKFAEPPDEDVRRDVFRVVPKIADLPYLAQPYNVDYATIDDLYHGPGAYAVLGAPGSGRTTALHLIALTALGIAKFPAPDDKVALRLKAEEEQLDSAQKAERLKYRLTVEEQAMERLVKENADTGLRDVRRRQTDADLIPYRNRFPVYVHLSDVRPSNFQGQADPAEPLVRGLQAQVGPATSKALPRRLYPKLERGGVVLLIDGYDDLTPEHQAEIADWLPVLLAQYGDNHIIVAGPEQGYAPLVQAGLAPLMLRPWSDADLQSAVEKWAIAWPDYLAGRRRRRRIAGSAPDEQQVQSAWDNARGLSAADTTLKIMAAYRGEPGWTPGAWLENYLDGLSLTEAQVNLARRAAAVQLDANAITAERTLAVPGAVAPDAKPPNDARGLGELFKRGVLIEIGRGEYQFRHKAMGAYFAAQALMDATDEELAERALDPAWDPALAYAAGMRPVEAAANARLNAPADVLYSGLTSLARWLSYLDGKPAWRANLLRQIGNLFVQPGQYPYARERLGAALAGSRDPDAAAIFERALKSPDADVRRISALALGVLRHAPAVEMLGGMLRDVEMDVKLAAAAALGAIGADEADDELGRAFAFGDEPVKQIAAETFAQMPEVGYETLYEAARHDNMDYRRAAVFGLKRMKPGWALLEVFRVFVEDSQWYVRSAAQEAVIDFQNHANAQALRPYPPATSVGWLRDWAVQAGLKGEDAPDEALTRILTTPDERMQPVAAQAVGQLALVDRAAALYRALLDSQPQVRDAAHRGLAELGLLYSKPLPSPA